ncbi:hypothetical protein FJT64_012043 [Amphibalanus amphitrite]|uniref:G-protein coupled receptors family 1 profile domain-containing protein n=1 Tax=Amphibalanus amphitrite TaxID=1232801 RepID=A0A6A4VK34_AMPAM|nr:hypothetical protein FJT64_012043 [Amphibalanus amphitrite]
MNATGDNCVLQMPQLRCQRLAVSTAAGANTSRLVCAASDGQERATDMYAALVALSVLIVPVAALLNLAVVVTVYMNRRLHTVINVLVTVLCMNNVMWTGIPIILVSFPNLRHPAACSSFLFIFVVSRSVMFACIVMITLLRYFTVVKNHHFPPNKYNIAFFVAATLAVGVTKWVLQTLFKELRCQKEIAWTPDNFVILEKLDESTKVAPATVVLFGVEYGCGIGILIFCYVKILKKTAKSRGRLDQFRNGQPPGQETKHHGTTGAKLDGKAQKDSNSTLDHKASGSLSQPVLDGLDQPSTSAQRLPVVAVSERGKVSPPRLVAQSDGIASPAALPEIEPDTLRKSVRALRFRQKSSTSSHSSLELSALQPAPPTAAAPAAAAASTDLHQPAADHPSPPPLRRARSCLLLQPARLLHLTCREPAGAAGERPRPRASRRRVDIVAGASLAGCLLLFLAAFIPVLFIASVMAGTPCVILPWRRLLTMVSIILGSGGAAVFSAVLLVVFSRDFRQAFVRTCRAAAGAVGVSSEYATRNSEQRQTGNDSGHRQAGDESRHRPTQDSSEQQRAMSIGKPHRVRWTWDNSEP